MLIINSHLILVVDGMVSHQDHGDKKPILGPHLLSEGKGEVS